MRFHRAAKRRAIAQLLAIMLVTLSARVSTAGGTATYPFADPVPSQQVSDDRIAVTFEQAGLARHVFTVRINWSGIDQTQAGLDFAVANPASTEAWTLFAAPASPSPNAQDPLAGRAVRRIRPQRVVIESATLRTATLYFNVPAASVKKSDDVFVGVTADIGSPPITGEVYFVRSTVQQHLNPEAGITASVAPGIVPQQELEDGSKHLVGQVELNLGIASLFPEVGAGDWYLGADLKLSTLSEDTSAKVGFRGGYKFFQAPVPVVQYLSYSLEGSHEVSQSGNRGLSAVALTVETLLPIEPFGGTGRSVQMPYRPRLAFTPIRYESRRTQTPGHGRTNLYGSAATVAVGPIFLLAQSEPSVRKDISLSFTVSGWYFPTEEATAGFRAKRFESSYSVELGLPILAGLQVPLILTYRNGADPSNFYSPSSSFGLFLDLYGRRVRL